MEPWVLEARDLGHDQPGLGDTNVDERLDLETVAPKPLVVARLARRSRVQSQDRHMPPPEYVEAITKI
ncbi:MAG: hypothetical protein ABSA53_15835 [Streptosporangiaceae bacterium]|jgi:hypothetical protein